MTTGIRLSRDWQAQPDLKRERDAKFFAGAAAHNRWPTLARFTCSAVVRGKRCSRIGIIETGHKHCIKHAGPTAARAYRENCRRLFDKRPLPVPPVVRGRGAPDADPHTRPAAAQARRLGAPRSDAALLARARSTVPDRRGTRAARPAVGGVPDYHRDQLRWAWRK